MSGYYAQVSTAGAVSFITNQSGANQSSQTLAGTISTGTWYHMAYVRRGASVRIYINGVDSTSTVATHINPSSSFDNFEFGRYAPSNIEMNGQVDELRVYDRVLSADEVAQLYRLSAPTGTDTGLKGYWSFNGKDLSGTTAYDRSGAGNNGTLTNGPAITEGKLGQGLNFDGTDDYVVVNNTTTTYQFPNTTFTVAGWFKKTGPSNGYIVTQDACNGGWGVYLTSGITLYIKAAGSCGLTVASRTSSTTTLNDGAWHHFAVIVTTNTTTSVGNDISIYIDGALDQGSITRDGSTYGLVSTNLKIGTSDGLGGYHGGAIDEIRLYNRALTTAEIKSLYNSSR